MDTHTIAPCQGFAVGGRTPFPISSGASIALNLTRDAKNVHIRYTNLADPKSNDDFSPLSTNITQAYRGSRCVDQPDFAARGLKVGDDVTMQLWYTSGPQNTTVSPSHRVRPSNVKLTSVSLVHFVVLRVRRCDARGELRVRVDGPLLPERDPFHSVSPPSASLHPASPLRRADHPHLPSYRTRGNANPALSSIAAASASASASLAAAGSTTSNTGGAGRSAVVGGGLGVAVMGAVAMLL